MSEYDEPISHLAEEKLAWQARAIKAEEDARWHEAETSRYKQRLLGANAARIKAEEALREAPRPTASDFDIVAYMDWFFQVRGAALSQDRGE